MIQSHRKRTRASTSRAVRRATAGLAAIALASTSFALTTPTFATSTVEVPRTSGADRYATSAAVSAATFTTTSTNVVLASGTDFPDGLSAAPLAGQLDAPILLVPSTGTLPAAIKTEITRLGATKGFIIGGTAAISADMEAQLVTAGLATMVRYAGADRYSTSKAVTTALDSIGTDNAKPTAFLATGGQFADALAASGPSFSANMPLILTNSFALNANAKAALTLKGITKVIVLGGVNAISTGIVTEIEAMGIEVVRLSGATRNDTAAAIAGYVAGDADYGFTKTGVVLTRGTSFADALSAGPHSGRAQHPVLFVESTVPAATSAYLTANASTMATVRIIGGASVIPESVIPTLKTAAGGTTAVSFTVSPSTTETKTVSTSASDKLNQGSRTFTATGLDATKTYSVGLFYAANIKTATNGLKTFTSAATVGNTAGIAIETINGSPNVLAVAGGGDAQVDGVSPVSGTITFSVDAESAARIVPLIWLDADGGADLDFTTAPSTAVPQAPSETIGMGGVTNLVPVEGASAGGFTIAAPLIIGLDKDANTFWTAGATYYYDSGDNFQIAAAPASLATFEANLSSLDGLGTSTYADDAALVSTFNLADAAPATPAIPVLTDVGSTSVKITSAAVAGATEYVFLRSTTVGGTYTEVGRSATRDFTNTGLNAATAYFWKTRGVIDGDESVSSVSETATTGAADSTVRPLVLDARLSTDAGVQGRLTTADVYKIVFNKTMHATTESAGLFVLQDASGDTAEIDCAVNAADCTLNIALETVGSTEYAIGRVLTVTVTALNLAVNDITPVEGVQYPVSLLTTNADVKDATANVVNLTDSTDKVVDAE